MLGYPPKWALWTLVLGAVLNARVIGSGGRPDLESIFEATLVWNVGKRCPKWFWPLDQWWLYDWMISHLQRDQGNFGISKIRFKKTLGGLMKAKKSNRTSLEQSWSKRRLMRKSFYTWLMTERNHKSNAPKAIPADLHFTSLLFPSIQMTSTRSIAIRACQLSFNLGDFDAIWKNTKPTKRTGRGWFFSASLL